MRDLDQATGTLATGPRRARILLTLACGLAVAAPAAAAPARPQRAMVWENVDVTTVSAQVNSHIIYLNRCAGAGCNIVQGTTNSTTDPVHSSLGHGVLSPFSRGDTTWNTIVSCMREVFAPFNVELTE